LSENIDCNLSIGVTATGKIGEDIIIGILSVDKDDEIKILVNNLLNSSHLVNIPSTDKNNKSNTNNSIVQKYIANMIRDKTHKLALFRLQPQEQFKLLREITTLEGQKLYEIGKAIDATNYQYIAKSMQLRYQYPKLFVDTFMKSLVQYYGLNWLLKEYDCGHGQLFKQNILEERRMALHIIVDGGAHFSSYQDLLNENLKNFWSTIKTNEGSTFYWNLMIATHGISNANHWYPVVSSIDFIVSNITSNLHSVIYSDNTLIDVKAEEVINQEDHVGKSILEILHEHYLERTGSTFRPPKLWRIGEFNDLGEYRQALPYVMLQKSIKEKRITAREVDDDIENIERFYQYNNPLDRDAFLVGQIDDDHLEIIDLLKEQGIEGITAIDQDLIDEYRLILDSIRNFVQKDECIISQKDQKEILKKIDNIEKKDFKRIDKISIPEII
jgi:hypothetical protein